MVVLCNLKPRNMRGIKSNGMVLCASNAAHDAVEPLLPPADAPVGERVWFGEAKAQPAAAEPNRVQKWVPPGMAWGRCVVCGGVRVDGRLVCCHSEQMWEAVAGRVM